MLTFPFPFLSLFAPPPIQIWSLGSCKMGCSCQGTHSLWPYSSCSA